MGRVCWLAGSGRQPGGADGGVFVCGLQVRAGDLVVLTVGGGRAGGHAQSRTGTVQYVWRGVLFVTGRELMDTGGFVVVRASKCKVSWCRAAATASAALTRPRLPARWFRFAAGLMVIPLQLLLQSSVGLRGLLLTLFETKVLCGLGNLGSQAAVRPR